VTYQTGGNLLLADGQVTFIYFTTTTTHVYALNNPAEYGNLVQFNANVTGSKVNRPRGNVALYDNGTVLLVVPLDSTSQALFSISTGLPTETGLHYITAAYEGDDNNLPSTSATLNQIVLAAPPTTTLPPSSTTSSSSAGTMSVNHWLGYIWMRINNCTAGECRWAIVLGIHPVFKNFSINMQEGDMEKLGSEGIAIVL